MAKERAIASRADASGLWKPSLWRESNVVAGKAAASGLARSSEVITLCISEAGHAESVQELGGHELGDAASGSSASTLLEEDGKPVKELEVLQLGVSVTAGEASFITAQGPDVAEAPTGCVAEPDTLGHASCEPALLDDDMTCAASRSCGAATGACEKELCGAAVSSNVSTMCGADGKPAKELGGFNFADEAPLANQHG